MLTIRVPKEAGPLFEPRLTGLGPLTIRPTYGGWFSKYFFVEISEEGGCACSMMHDDDAAEPAGLLRPDILDRLAATVAAVGSNAPVDFDFLPLWVGDKPRAETPVTLPKLVECIRRNALVQGTRYVVKAVHPAPDAA
jgi:hypothetical protein